MRSLRALACAASVGAAAACAAAPSSTFAIHGTYAIYGDIGAHFAVSGKRCLGSRDARGIVDGTPVTVTDTHDLALATGALHGGTFISASTRGGACVFRLAITGVTDDRGYYRLVIGGRRVEQLSNAEAHQRLALTWYAH